MEGLGTVFGVIALLVALVALWFVNDVVKRIERQNQQFLDTHLRPLREAVEKCTAKLAVLERKAGETAGQIADLQRKGEALAKAQSEHRDQLEAMREGLDRLSRDVASTHRRPAASGRRAAPTGN